ncbi:DUF7669 domain-containing protein [Nocardioides xinjiangensis]|uniref:DUF7669 domain-containing protein n=1 Tax=Nocardioides xinjiangensis TaxID=2817376 RepID=UPI001B314154|nr:hypothetical protein [Nocardioides sp. SYSU D00778]
MERTATTTWERLVECVRTLPEPFTAAEVISWFDRHYPGSNPRTIRAHVRGACSNVGNREQFTPKTPFLTKIAHGTFRRATQREITDYLAGAPTPAGGAASSGTSVAAARAGGQQGDWHTEANTQSLVVRHLRASGWTITRTANTATKEPGVDVVAERGPERIGIEVKGYPTRGTYADPRRAGETKKTNPATQARHWYSQAVLAAMRLRTHEPDWHSVIALPDFPTYRRLWADTRTSLDAARIRMWFVSEDGAVKENP